MTVFHVLAFIVATGVLAAGLIFHLVGIAVMILRARPGRASSATPAARLPSLARVTIIRPVCGVDFHLRENLLSTFELDDANYEVIFCVAEASDPAIALVRELIEAHPQVSARLLIGEDKFSANPKLNNCLKGWESAQNPWVIFVDSNVLMPTDYIQRMFRSWTPTTSLLSAPPIATLPEGFWAHLECAFLNTYQAPAQYFSDFFGFGFAQGKNMMWRKSDLEALGGIKALACEVAEDAASTKLVRARGGRVDLVRGPFAHPIGRRRFIEVWRRQARWASVRRPSFPRLFLSEILNGFFPLLLAIWLLAKLGALSFWPGAATLFAVWYGSELLLVLAAGWPISPWLPLHGLLRDLLLPCLWVYGYRGGGYTWRGNKVSVGETSEPSEPDSRDLRRGSTPQNF